MELNKIIEVLEKKYPLWLKEDWDNVGLSVGDTSADIKKILVTLDVTQKVIDYAEKKGCQLIIAHHPLIFKSIANVTNKTLTGKKIMKLASSGIALYSAHTNADSAINGLNDFVAKKLGAESISVVDKKYYDTVKVSFFVPETHFEEIREKIMKINRFTPGNYDGVTYSAEYEETYTEINKGETYINNIENREISKVKKIEILVLRNQIKTLINEIKKIHPYEDPAYEISEIEKRFCAGGIGRIFDLKEKTDIEEYLKNVKKSFQLEKIKAVYEKGQKVKKIGIVNGSGMTYLKKMKDAGVDLFITADVKYHEALEAKEYGVNVADIGHYESEIFFGEMVLSSLSDMDIEIEIYNDEAVFKII